MDKCEIQVLQENNSTEYRRIVGDNNRSGMVKTTIKYSLRFFITAN